MLQFIQDFLHNVQAICMQLPTSSSCLTCSVSKCRTLALARHFSNWQNRMKPSTLWNISKLSTLWFGLPHMCHSALIPEGPWCFVTLVSNVKAWRLKLGPQGLCQWAWESRGDRHIDVHWRNDKRWPNLWGCLQGTAGDAKKAETSGERFHSLRRVCVTLRRLYIAYYL